MDLRCEHKKHGEIILGYDGDVVVLIEIKCSSRFCGAGPGVVVIHRWDALTGARLEDKRFAVPTAIARQTREAARL